METGYKAFKASVMKSIQIEEHRFGLSRRFSPNSFARPFLTNSSATSRDVQQGYQVAKIALNFLGHARAAVPALSRLMLALARAPASAARAD